MIEHEIARVEARATSELVLNNRNIKDFKAWLLDNALAIAAYLLDCGLTKEEATDDFLEVLVNIQWERQQQLILARPESHYESAPRRRFINWEHEYADFVCVPAQGEI